MAENGKGSSRKEAITIENFMTVEEINDKNRQKVRELEVLRAELNSVKKTGNPLFVSSYSDNPTGTVLFRSNNPAKLRSVVEKDYQSLRKKTSQSQDKMSNVLKF